MDALKRLTEAGCSDGIQHVSNPFMSAVDGVLGRLAATSGAGDTAAATAEFSFARHSAQIQTAGGPSSLAPPLAFDQAWRAAASTRMPQAPSVSSTAPFRGASMVSSQHSLAALQYQHSLAMQQRMWLAQQQSYAASASVSMAQARPPASMAATPVAASPLTAAGRLSPLSRSEAAEDAYLRALSAGTPGAATRESAAVASTRPLDAAAGPAAADAELRAHARAIADSLRGSAGSSSSSNGGGRWAESEFFRFMQAVGDGTASLSDSEAMATVEPAPPASAVASAAAPPASLLPDYAAYGPDGVPHADELARRMRILSDMWRQALESDGSADVDAIWAQAVSATTDTEGGGGAAAEAAAVASSSTPRSFEQFMAETEAQLGARVDASPETRAAQEARLRLAIEEAFAEAAWDDAGGCVEVGGSSFAPARPGGAGAEAAASQGGGALSYLALQPYALGPASDNPFLQQGAAELAGESSRTASSSSAPPSSLDALFAEGMRLFEAGETGRAVAALEAVLARAPEHADAWAALGACWAELDHDTHAIACLQRAVEHDPYHLGALLALGTSYVNVKAEAGALRTLRAWAEAHPRLHGRLRAEDDGYSDGSELDAVSQLLIQADSILSAAAAAAAKSGAPAHAGLAAADAGADASAVAAALGALYNVSGDFGSAAAAFRRALATAPATTAAGGRHALLNRLGASLSQLKDQAGALAAYDAALRCKPAFARCWFNRGIALFNAGAPVAAAQAYLHALRLSPGAAHIWPLVRSSLAEAGRYDLVARTEACNPDAFLGEPGLGVPTVPPSASGSGDV